MNNPVWLGAAGVSTPTLLEDLNAAAESDVNVLITAERSAGASTIAQLIHLQSRRGSGPLVTLDCAAAVRRENFDRLDMARGGTIFIDHVEELSAEMQARLMRFLDTDCRLLDVRVITAGDRCLLDKMAGGAFREDLFYRLNVIHLAISPEGERTAANPVAATAF